MDGVVIHMSSTGGGAIIWCEDQGPLALVRREDLLAAADKPLAVGDFVRFDIIEEGDIRICSAISLHAARSMPDLPHLLRRDEETRRRRRNLTLVQCGESSAPREFGDARLCLVGAAS